jgi:hypothetical protein
MYLYIWMFFKYVCLFISISWYINVSMHLIEILTRWTLGYEYNGPIGLVLPSPLQADSTVILLI